MPVWPVGTHRGPEAERPGGRTRTHPSLRVWPVKVPDLSPDILLYALEECVATGERGRTARRLEARWSARGDALTCLSVRTGFDLLLRAAGWAPGDEVVFTAVTIPDMVRIAGLHGLRAVALDVDPVTAEPHTARLAEVVGPRTRALVHAHLFGGRADVSALAEAAHRHGLLFVEDCAQCYRGPGWTGHEASDVTLFSFGPWKTATALGGALVRVKDGPLRDRMRKAARRDPVQDPSQYLATVLAYGALTGAAVPDVYGLLVEGCRVWGTDHRRLVHRITKGYRGSGFRARIRRRPAAALLAVLERRLDQGDAPVRRREGPAGVLLEALGPDVVVPGRRPEGHGWWMMPVAVGEDRAVFMDRLLEEGFDTSRGRLTAVDGGPGRDAPAGAHRLLRSTVFIPFGPEIPEAELRRLGAAARRALGSSHTGDGVE